MPCVRCQLRRSAHTAHFAHTGHFAHTAHFAHTGHTALTDLVVASLQERRVDGHKRREALACEARRKRDGVLLRDADVKHPIREALVEA
eukprot:366013-Chlamydomonas_euryale.AAC.14